MDLSRSKLFLSYSSRDGEWRKLFVRHLRTMLVLDEELWVDQESMRGGEGWAQQIGLAAQQSRCALLLVTPNYLDKSHFARDELDLLAKEQPRGLKLLPVLVEPCAWAEEPVLAQLQFVRWQNASIEERITDGARDVLRSIREAGAENEIDRAVIGACEHVKKELGVLAQTTSVQRDDLLDRARESLSRSNVQLDGALHCGDFCVVYRGRWNEETVAVKVVPDAVRRNRVRALFDETLTKAAELRDPSFLRHFFHVTDREPHCVVMEYVEWPTLEDRLGQYPGRRLPPRLVAQLLATLARAQSEAHHKGLALGPLAPANIHAGEDWDLRISPIRIEGQLSKLANLTTGQLMNWDVLTTLSPESCEGLFPAERLDVDRQELYYLGLLGLQLLLGHRPFEVRRFADFRIKEQFFANPRGFFGDGTHEGQWTETDPALAFLLAALLARDPKQRFASADDAVGELTAITEGTLPASVRRCLDNDFEAVSSATFAEHFYERLLRRRPELARRFPDIHAQEQRFAEALLDLLEFRPDATRSRFKQLAQEHADYNLSPADYQAFHQAFIEEVVATAPGGQASGDAWKAALNFGLSLMSELAGPKPP